MFVTREMHWGSPSSLEYNFTDNFHVKTEMERLGPIKNIRDGHMQEASTNVNHREENRKESPVWGPP